MARKNLVNQSVATAPEIFCRLRDFLCKRNGTYDYSTTGIGWTLHDYSYANANNPVVGDWFVAKSIGESGNEDLYFKITYSSTTYITISGYQYWNNSTHVGTQAYTSGSGLNVSGLSSPTIFLYGDLDHFILFLRGTSAATDLYTLGGGKFTNGLFSANTYFNSNDLLTGANTIQIGTVPADWFVGMKLFIRNNTSIEKFAITAIGESSVQGNLTNGYSIGAKISPELLYHCINGPLNSGIATLIGHDGTKNAIYSSGFQGVVSIGTYSSPEPMNNTYVAVPFVLEYSAYGYGGEIPGVLSRPSAVTLLSTLTDKNGNSYRAITSSGKYLAVLEV